MLREWTRRDTDSAMRMALSQVAGVGGQEWDLWQYGDTGIHYRRRLSTQEMKLLHSINSACPVFTHGKALSRIAEDIRP